MHEVFYITYSAASLDLRHGIRVVLAIAIGIKERGILEWLFGTIQQYRGVPELPKWWGSTSRLLEINIEGHFERGFAFKLRQQLIIVVIVIVKWMAVLE